jgi:hypothetical protein
MGRPTATRLQLPGPLKTLAEWHHKRRWSRRNVRKLRTADAVVVSHTKSGRTWLRVMISYLYHLEYGTPANEVIGFDNLHALNPAIPRIYFTRDTNVPRFLHGKTHEQVASDKKVLFLLRDPRDAAVSFYFHVRNRASAREMIRKGIDPEARSLPVYEFVIDEQLGVSRVIRHYNRWLEEMKSLPHTLVVRYEDLRADPVDSLGRIIGFLDREFSHEQLVKAVEFAAFDSLSRKEKEGFFSSGRLRPADPGETGSYKVRRGKVGGYRDYFTAEQNDRIDALVREQLDPFFGYY